MSSQLIDKAVIAELEMMGKETNSDLLNEVISLFLGEAPNKIVDMKAALAKEDLQNLSKLAHHFRSSCNGVGVPLSCSS